MHTYMYTISPKHMYMRVFLQYTNCGSFLILIEAHAHTHAYMFMYHLHNVTNMEMYNIMIHVTNVSCNECTCSNCVYFQTIT